MDKNNCMCKTTVYSYRARARIDKTQINEQSASTKEL